jgi:nucleoside-triphosphatase
MVASHVVIDEIGKMECLSKQFRRLVTAILSSGCDLHRDNCTTRNGIHRSVKQRPDVTLFAIDRGNRDSLATVLLQAIQ